MYLSTCYILLSYVHANENIKFSHGQNNLSELNVQVVPPAPESVLQSSPPPEQCLEWVLGYSRESCTLTCSRVSRICDFALLEGVVSQEASNLALWSRVLCGRLSVPSLLEPPANLKELFLFKTGIHMMTGERPSASPDRSDSADEHCCPTLEIIITLYIDSATIVCQPHKVARRSATPGSCSPPCHGASRTAGLVSSAPHVQYSTVAANSWTVLINTF